MTTTALRTAIAAALIAPAMLAAHSASGVTYRNLQMRFYESGFWGTFEKRPYAATFEPATPYIWFEVSFAFDLPKGQAVDDANFDCMYYGPDGAALGAASGRLRLWASPTHYTNKRGTDVNPYWAPGKYRVECRIDNTFTVAGTFDVVHGAKAAAAAETAATPTRATTPAPAAPVAAAPASHMLETRVCVIENGALHEVTAMYNRLTGDKTVGGRDFDEVYYSRPGYAGGEDWYINNEAITLAGKRYEKFGLPRVLGINDVTRIAEHKGIGVFAESRTQSPPDTIYIPVRYGCEFQPYQMQSN